MTTALSVTASVAPPIAASTRRGFLLSTSAKESERITIHSQANAVWADRLRAFAG
jgi:hypothetical protein